MVFTEHATGSEDAHVAELGPGLGGRHQATANNRHRKKESHFVVGTPVLSHGGIILRSTVVSFLLCDDRAAGLVDWKNRPWSDSLAQVVY